ncbi:MAG: hypothetical protein HOQ27_10040 [Dermatophilaceae bacterium]|nr:hypothetical protein [Dermatophilaceae bacterium]
MVLQQEFRYGVVLQQPVVDGLGTVGDVPVLTIRGAGALVHPSPCRPHRRSVITLRAA